MLDAPIRRILASPLERLAVGAVRIGLSANTITVFGFLMGLAAAAFIADEDYVLGLVCLALNRLADILDGIVARIKGATAVGAFLDASLDLFVYAAIPFSFALSRQQDALAATFLLMGLMMSAVPSLAAKAVSPLAPASKAVSTRAFCEHSETFLAFVLMCVAPRWMFSLIAYFYGFLCFISGTMRILSAVANLRAAAKP
jgi:phosphatidylglycerophosphate synthase